jgi:phosphatidylglycerophosphate synthase
MLLIWSAHVEREIAFRKVCGLTLVKRAALAGEAAGFERVAVAVLPGQADAFTAELADARFRRAPEVFEIASAPSAQLSHLSKLWREEEIAVALVDRVFTGPALKALAAPLAEGERCRAVGGDDPGAIWSGLVRVRRADLGAVPIEGEVTLAQASAAFGGAAVVADGVAWRRVAGPEDLREAETILLRALVKAADGVISRHVNRKISLFLSRRLSRTGVLPNHVTAVVFLVGAASGPLAFFVGGYAGFALGALCYYLSAILDGCDGEISRLKYQGSPLGAWLDTVVDDTVCLSYLLGIYPRLALDAGGAFWWWVGGFGVLFYLLTVLPRYWIMATRLKSGDFQKLAAKRKPEAKELTAFGRAVQAVRNVIFRTDFLPFYAFVTAAVCFVPAFALPFAVGSIASAVDTAMTILEK